MKTSGGEVSSSSTPLLVVLGISLLMNLVVGIQVASTMVTGQRREGWENVQNVGQDWIKKLLDNQNMPRRRRKLRKGETNQDKQ